MAQTMVNFRMDTEEKDTFEDICEQLGLTVSTAFKMFVKKVIREQRIPFDLSLDPFYSKPNIQYLEKVTQEIYSGKAVLSEHELVEA
ncbi:MAG: type II toxin-antitoxin system RelB/DinJ family antitoxin [Treponema sp.]|nr:type II toxin-antitoxin system RelB/DinJ family antitoxin [Treponema sp.]